MKRLEAGPGFVRYVMGSIYIVALHDGHVDMPLTRLRREGDRPFGVDRPAGLVLVDGRLRLSVNAFLIIERGGHILIDTGAGNSWEPSMGHLPDAFAEAGISRDDIGTVVLTHTHTDHVGGLVANDGSEAFPKLRRLLVPQAELGRFDGNERLARFRDRRRPLVDGFALSGSVTALKADGHEVGHTAFQVSSGGTVLLVWGDIVHVPSIQFAHPGLTWEYDADQDQARRTRAAMLDRAARRDTFVAGAHLDFPGIGQVSRDENGFIFSPV